MIVVSNSSPLAALSFIGELDLLHQLYGIVLIPDAVWQEVAIAGANLPGREAVLNADWLERRTVKNHQLVKALFQDLDPGESEAIVLALETKAELLIMDERLGRRTARHFDLNVIGVVGILIEAKHRGLVNAIHPYLDRLRDIAGFRISDGLYRRVLEEQDEM